MKRGSGASAAPLAVEGARRGDEPKEESVQGMIGSDSFNGGFPELVIGHWLDSIGNSIVVSRSVDKEDELTAVLTPLTEHPLTADYVETVRLDGRKVWRCGGAVLEWADEESLRIVWSTDDGRRAVWSRSATSIKAIECENDFDGVGPAFPWLLNAGHQEPWFPHDFPKDVLYDGARVAALLDIRQLIGAKTETQERLTHILMDHDLQNSHQDYLVPGIASPLWNTLPVNDCARRSILQRVAQIQNEALSQRVCWSGDSEIWVGHHKISCSARDIQTLDSRWALEPKDPTKPVEIARLLALYSVIDNPLSNRRSGIHLGLHPDLRRLCDYELFASPLNAVVSNGHYASKWPHAEWRFGSIGSYPGVIEYIPRDAIVCVNPPFTDAYLADVMMRITALKSRFRLRVAIPIQEATWRKELQNALPSAKLLRSYYDASRDQEVELLHPTLFWEDHRCPDQSPGHVFPPSSDPFDIEREDALESAAVGYNNEGCGDGMIAGCGDGLITGWDILNDDGAGGIASPVLMPQPRASLARNAGGPLPAAGVAVAAAAAAAAARVAPTMVMAPTLDATAAPWTIGEHPIISPAAACAAACAAAAASAPAPPRVSRAQVAAPSACDDPNGRGGGANGIAAIATGPDAAVPRRNIAARTAPASQDARVKTTAAVSVDADTPAISQPQTASATPAPEALPVSARAEAAAAQVVVATASGGDDTPALDSSEWPALTLTSPCKRKPLRLGKASKKIV